MTIRKNGWSPISLPLAFLVIYIMTLLAGLWPLDFHPKNNVSWIGFPGGVHFDGLGIAYSAAYLFGPGLPLRPGGPVSIELALRPSSGTHRKVTQLLTLCDSKGRNLFIVGQFKSDLILRVDNAGNRPSPFREISASNVLRGGVVAFLTITSDQRGTTIHLNGEKVEDAPGFSLLPMNPGTGGILSLGNATVGTHQWEGDLFFLGIHDRILTPGEVVARCRHPFVAGNGVSTNVTKPFLGYFFDENQGQIARSHGNPPYDIVIPHRFRVIRKTVLSLPWDDPWDDPWCNWSFAGDVALNFSGFLPFGLFCAGWLRKRDHVALWAAIISVALLGAVTSLIIELLQVYLPTRNSSLADVLFNTFGAGFGAYFTEWFRDVFPASPAQT